MTAGLLLGARLHRERLRELPSDARPSTVDEGYAAQDGVVDSLLTQFGGSVIGYKIACTNAIAQQFLKTPEPFYGRLLSASTFDSHATLPASNFFMRVIESEFAFQFARDLPPAGPRLDREEIAQSLAGVLPGIELVDSRFEVWTSVGVPSLIADNACHGAWIKGALIPDWSAFDLAAQEVTLSVNGAIVQRGSGSAVLGHPLNALEWLVARLHARGIGLLAGQYVTTGVTTDIYNAQPGDHLRADFGPVGTVELTMS